MKIIVYFTVACSLAFVSCLENGLARTPPMGWLSWERFRCNIDCVNDPDNCISENLYKAMADELVKGGYKDVGYEYVNIDDCWPLIDRDAKGFLVADPKRFPSGMKALADYVHSKGLKLGIYGDFGTKTCGGYPGSEFYMEQDANTFASWGIDSLKLDGCNSRIADMPFGYPIMEFYLNQTGRPILYSCSWPAYTATPDYKAIAKSCNIWRNYNDIQDSWDSVSGIVEFYAANKLNFSQIAGPGHFNDPDMLIIGDFGLSHNQERYQMAMWAIMASPLYMSNDLRRVPEDSKAILLNRNVIAINQDPLGVQGNRVIKQGDIEIWTRPLQGNSVGVLVSCTGGATTAQVKFQLTNIGLNNPSGYNLTEVFEGQFVGIFKPTETLNISIDPYDVFLVKAKQL
ncbi:alpha-N-acetylgalactosaminidase [Patella vulgata]|uniref:alpha-N-acetylgalactosaminidase n=1 Tax=Patella vulgata TaxID=6465 RepID=UPI002180693A|nr:alpha-N-acetylgalactosaminidase [Patella vulgata]